MPQAPRRTRPTIRATRRYTFAALPAALMMLVAPMPAPGVVTPVDGASAPRGFDAVLVDPDTSEFTGDPITLALKDAEIKDVLRTFSELTGLNIVVHPAVRGSVTVQLRNVPWDQALDIILRVNGLAYQLEGNILYVAPPEHLLGSTAR